MSEQEKSPFNEPFFWISPEGDEYRVDPDGNTEECRGDRWIPVHIPSPLAAELLRRLRESQEREKRLKASCESARDLLFSSYGAAIDAVCAAPEEQAEFFAVRDGLKDALGQQSEHVVDVTPAILEAVGMLVTDWNERRKETGLDPDALSPQMQKLEELLADLQAGRIMCRRTG